MVVAFATANLTAVAFFRNVSIRIYIKMVVEEILASNTETYLEPCQISMINILFSKIVNG